MAITVCSLACILNSFVCCGEFSGFVCSICEKPKRWLLSPVCSDTSHWYGQQAKKGRSSSSSAVDVFIYCCRPPRASFSFLLLAGRRVCSCVRCTCSLPRQQVLPAGFLGFARGHDQAAAPEPGWFGITD